MSTKSNVCNVQEDCCLSAEWNVNVVKCWRFEAMSHDFQLIEMSTKWKFWASHVVDEVKRRRCEMSALWKPLVSTKWNFGRMRRPNRIWTFCSHSVRYVYTVFIACSYLFTFSSNSVNIAVCILLQLLYPLSCLTCNALCFWLHHVSYLMLCASWHLPHASFGVVLLAQKFITPKNHCFHIPENLVHCFHIPKTSYPKIPQFQKPYHFASPIIQPL